MHNIETTVSLKKRSYNSLDLANKGHFSAFGKSVTILATPCEGRWGGVGISEHKIDWQQKKELQIIFDFI